MMRSKALLLIALAVLALAVAWLFLRESQNDRELEGVAHGKSPGGSRGADDVAAPTRDGSNAARSEVALPVKTAATAAESPPIPGQALKTAGGRVLDTSGSPLAGLALALHEAPQHEIARSSADGRFEFSVPLEFMASRIELVPGQRWACACDTPVQEGRLADLLVVAAPAIELGGVVEDEKGAAVAGAKISLRLSSQELRDFPLPLDRNSPIELSAVSTASGAFHLDAVPAVAACSLRASLGESLSATTPLPMNTTLDLRIVLRAHSSEKSLHISGIVLSAAGQPVDEALVVLGSTSTKSTADGRFALVAPERERVGQQIYAVKQGFQPAALDISDLLARNDVPEVVLQLGPEALEIHGKVLLADGSPAPNWTVALAAETELSLGKSPPVMAEEIAAGAELDSGSSSTDAAGEFTLHGLSARSYDVRAWDGTSLLAVRAEAVAAGTHDLVLRVPPEASWAELRGTVVNRHGAPIPKARVYLDLTTSMTRNSMTSISSDATETSEDGSFRLTNVPRSEVRLSVSGENVILASFEVSSLHPENGLKLTVDMRCHFRLLCERKDDLPDGADVLDANGAKMSIFTFQNAGWMSTQHQWIEGKSATHAFAVGESAQTLVLFHGAKEIARLPLMLVPGQVTEVRY